MVITSLLALSSLRPGVSTVDSVTDRRNGEFGSLVGSLGPGNGPAGSWALAWADGAAPAVAAGDAVEGVDKIEPMDAGKSPKYVSQ